MKVLLELRQRTELAYWHAVADHVQVRSCKINDLLAPLIFDVCVTNIPFPWNRPIEDCSPGRYFVHIQLDLFANLAERFPYAVAGDATTNRIHLCGKGKD